MTEATRSYPDVVEARRLEAALYEAECYGIGATSDTNQRVILQAASAYYAERPSGVAQQAVDCGEMVRVAKMAKAAAEMELGLAASPDFSPRDMLDAANAALSTVPSTDPRCTCAAIVNPNIPHARSCPLSSTEGK